MYSERESGAMMSAKLCAHAERLQKGPGTGATDVSDRAEGAVPQSESVQWLRGDLAPSGEEP